MVFHEHEGGKSSVRGGVLTRPWVQIKLCDARAWNETEVIGQLSERLADAGFSTQLADQTIAWRAQLSVLRECAKQLCELSTDAADWTLALEYEIPRRNRRVDAILFCRSVIVAIEFKVNATRYLRPDIWQVQDYALDIRDFHEQSATRNVAALLVATNAPPKAVTASLDPHEVVWFANASNLPRVLCQINSYYSDELLAPIDPTAWLAAGYRPTPTIVEAARRVFAGHNIRELSHSYADNLTRTTDTIARIVSMAKAQSRRVVCFVTGVPGSGKTLAGLTAMQDAKSIEIADGQCAFMSGNGPLVKVLREALVRDEASRGGTKKAARRHAELLIQNVHRFIEEYGVNRPTDMPPEHVIAFDEAQRAWHGEKLSKRHKGIDRSEPSLVLDVMERPKNWSVVVAIVGGGQEIHDGEAGLEEWGRALVSRSVPWDVVVSPEVLDGGTSVAGHQLFTAASDYHGPVTTDTSMHLSVSVRSPRAQHLAEWVNAVIDLDSSCALHSIAAMRGFRLAMTRDLGTARKWLRENATGTLRAGLVASSGALRLRAYGLELDPDFHRAYPIERWFLDERDDYRSSHALEVAMTEFECQGLELDFVGLCWGSDLTVGTGYSSWSFSRLAGLVPREISNSVKRTYLLNKYRVLLSRAREGLVIWIPRGESNDKTRPVDPMDRTASFLRGTGIVDLDATQLAYE